MGRLRIRLADVSLGGLTVPESGDIWVMNADGTGKTQLTTDPGDDLRPAWSPSGTKIVFRSLRTNMGDIYRMKADGTQVTQLTDDPAQDANPTGSRSRMARRRTTDEHGANGIRAADELKLLVLRRVSSDGTSPRLELTVLVKAARVTG